MQSMGLCSEQGNCLDPQASKDIDSDFGAGNIDNKNIKQREPGFSRFDNSGTEMMDGQMRVKPLTGVLHLRRSE